MRGRGRGESGVPNPPAPASLQPDSWCVPPCPAHQVGLGTELRPPLWLSYHRCPLACTPSWVSILPSLLNLRLSDFHLSMRKVGCRESAQECHRVCVGIDVPCAHAHVCVAEAVLLGICAKSHAAVVCTADTAVPAALSESPKGW